MFWTYIRGKSCLYLFASWNKFDRCSIQLLIIHIIYFFVENVWYVGRRYVVCIFEGLQAVVQQSTICPTGSRALWSQIWLRKIDARNCVDIFSYRTNRRNRFASFCEAMFGFAKLLSPKDKLWIVALLLGALHIHVSECHHISKVLCL